MANVVPAETRKRQGGSRAAGTVSHRPIPEPALVGRRILEAPPPRPDMPAEAKQFWTEHVAELFEIGAVSSVDVPALEEMCLHYAVTVRTRRVLDAQGYFTLGSTGQLTGHPGIGIVHNASQAFLRYASEFGLTAAARTRIGLQDAARRTLQHDLQDRLGPNPRRERAHPDVDSG